MVDAVNETLPTAGSLRDQPGSFSKLEVTITQTKGAAGKITQDVTAKFEVHSP